jgi:AcrR family transcriptional regulator
MEAYESFGRTNQKRRTRATIKEAAAEMIRNGATPTVTEVAALAGVSRATAYRYFPNQDALIAEVMLDRTVAPGLEAVHEAARSETTAGHRLDAVIRADQQLVVQQEAAFRTAIRAMILPRDPASPAGPRRPGNRLRYLTEALVPVTDLLGPERTKRLVTALAMVVGLESLLVLEDICGLNHEEAEATKRWAAASLLQAALDEAGDPQNG